MSKVAALSRNPWSANHRFCINGRQGASPGRRGEVQGNADSRYDELATAGGQTSAGPAASSSPQMRAPSLSPPRMASIRSLGCATSSRDVAAARIDRGRLCFLRIEGGL
jgi:hypothetical protein